MREPAPLRAGNEFADGLKQTDYISTLTDTHLADKLDPTLSFWGAPLGALSAPPSRCRSPMLSHSRSDSEFPILKQGRRSRTVQGTLQ